MVMLPKPLRKDWINQPFERFGIVWRVLGDGDNGGVEMELAAGEASVLVAEIQVLGEVAGQA